MLLLINFFDVVLKTKIAILPWHLIFKGEFPLDAKQRKIRKAAML